MYTVFKDNDGKYKIGLSKKNQKDEWERAYFPIRFRKDVELENKTKIYIKDYWLDFYNWEYQGKKGTTFYIFINKFETVDQTIERIHEENKEEKDPFKEMGDQVAMEQYETTDEDLPF
jgi:hypothetical protein